MVCMSTTTRAVLIVVLIAAYHPTDGAHNCKSNEDIQCVNEDLIAASQTTRCTSLANIEFTGGSNINTNGCAPDQQVTSAQACCARCVTTPGCFAYSFLTATAPSCAGACYLKRAGTRRTVNKNAVSGLVTTVAPTPSPSPGTCRVHVDTAFTGSDIVDGCAPAHVTDSGNHCCHKCHMTKGCMAWTWHNTTGTHACPGACYLKSQPTGQIPLQGAISGHVQEPTTTLHAGDTAALVQSNERLLLVPPSPLPPSTWSQFCPTATYSRTSSHIIIGTTLNQLCTSSTQVFQNPLGCCQSCAASSACSAWMHVAGGGGGVLSCGATCVLFTGTVMLQPIGGQVSHVMSGLRQPRLTAMANGPCMIVDALNLASSPLLIPLLPETSCMAVNSPENCCAQCRSYPGCQAWRYTKPLWTAGAGASCAGQCHMFRYNNTALSSSSPSSPSSSSSSSTTPTFNPVLLVASATPANWAPSFIMGFVLNDSLPFPNLTSPMPAPAVTPAMRSPLISPSAPLFPVSAPLSPISTTAPTPAPPPCPACPPLRATACACTTADNVGLVGTLLQASCVSNTQVPTSATCCERCRVTANCVAYSWAKLSAVHCPGGCWMYSTVQEQVYNTTWVSGVPPGQYFLPEPAPSEPAPLTASNWGPMEPRAPVPATCNTLAQVDAAGSSMFNGCGNTYPSAQGCCSHCQRVVDCVAYTWFDYNHTACPGSCWLKAAFNTSLFTQRATATTGFKGSPPTLPNSLPVVATTTVNTIVASPQQGTVHMDGGRRILQPQFPPNTPMEARQDDWFLDNNPHALPLHPYRFRSTLFPHPKGCPPFTVYQVHIYRQWVDDLTVTIPIFRSTEYNPYGNITHAWGGCFPHMQILHKGDMANNHKWPIRAWHSLSTPPIPARASDGALVWDDAFGNIGSFHWQFSDQTIYTAVQSLDPCGPPNGPDAYYTNRPYGHESLCTLRGGTWNSTWDETLATPTRDPTQFSWGKYVPQSPPNVPGNWTPWYTSCGYEQYCPRNKGDNTGINTSKPSYCGPQYNLKPELPVQWNYVHPAGSGGSASGKKRRRLTGGGDGTSGDGDVKSGDGDLTNGGSDTGLLPKAAAQAWHEEVAAKEAALRKLLMNPQYNTADKRALMADLDAAYARRPLDHIQDPVVQAMKAIAAESAAEEASILSGDLPPKEELLTMALEQLQHNNNPDNQDDDNNNKTDGDTIDDNDNKNDNNYTDNNNNDNNNNNNNGNNNNGNGNDDHTTAQHHHTHQAARGRVLQITPWTSDPGLPIGFVDPAPQGTHPKCSWFGPSTRHISGFTTQGNYGWKQFFESGNQDMRTSWPGTEPTCTYPSTLWFGVEDFMAFPYDYPVLGLVASNRYGIVRRKRTSNTTNDSEPTYLFSEAGYSLIAMTQPSDLYNTEILHQFTKYGREPTSIWAQAGAHPYDGVLQTVVKPVWNIPVGGTAYWQVSLRGCNADYGGYLLDSWQAYIDGEIERGKRGYLIASSTWYNQDVTTVLTNLTAMNLTSGWHTLELHLFQRSQRPSYFLAPRKLVSKHWFEVISDWPTRTNAEGKCSDWLTYPCFEGIYTEQRDSNLRLKYTTNVWFDDTYRPAAQWLDWNSYQRYFNLYFFDMRWLKSRGQGVRKVTLYINIEFSGYATRAPINPPQYLRFELKARRGLMHYPTFNTTDANTRLRVDGWTLVGELLMPKHNVPWYGRNSYIGIDLNTSWFNDALADGRDPSFTLSLEPTQSVDATVNIRTMWSWRHSPGGLGPFMRFLPADPACNHIIR